jgi:hypothetical protein
MGRDRNGSSALRSVLRYLCPRCGTLVGKLGSRGCPDCREMRLEPAPWRPFSQTTPVRSLPRETG